MLAYLVGVYLYKNEALPCAGYSVLSTVPLFDGKTFDASYNKDRPERTAVTPHGTVQALLYAMVTGAYCSVSLLKAIVTVHTPPCLPTSNHFSQLDSCSLESWFLILDCHSTPLPDVGRL